MGILSCDVTPLGEGFYMNKKYRTGGSGCVHLKSTHSMTMSGFSFKKALLGTECFLSLCVY